MMKKGGARYEQLMNVVKSKQEKRRKTRARSMLPSTAINSSNSSNPSHKEEFKKQLRRKTNAHSSLSISTKDTSDGIMNPEPTTQTGTRRTSATSMSQTNNNHKVLTVNEKLKNSDRASLHSPSSLKILQKVRRRSTTMQVLQNHEQVLNRAYLLKLQTKFLDNWRKLTMAHLFNADKICGRMFRSWKRLTSQMRAINRLSKPKTTRRKTTAGTAIEGKHQILSRNKSIANPTWTGGSGSNVHKQTAVKSSLSVTSQGLKQKKRNEGLLALQQEVILEEYEEGVEEVDKNIGMKEVFEINTSPNNYKQQIEQSPYARSKSKSISMSRTEHEDQHQSRSTSQPVIESNILATTGLGVPTSSDYKHSQNNLSYGSEIFDDSDLDSEVNIASDFFETSEAFESGDLNMMAEDHNERFHKWRALNKFKLCVLWRREEIKRMRRVFGSQTLRCLETTNNSIDDNNDALKLPENMIVTKYILLRKWFDYWQYIKARYQYAVDLKTYTYECRNTLLKRRAFLSLLSRRVGIRSYVKNIAADKFFKMLGDNHKNLAMRCFESGRDIAMQAYYDSTASAFENVAVLKKIYRKFLTNLHSNKVFKQVMRMKVTSLEQSSWLKKIASNAIKNWRRGLWIQKRRRKAKRKTKLLCITFLEGTVRRKFTIWRYRIQNRMYLYDKLDQGIVKRTDRYFRLLRKQINRRRDRLDNYQNIIEGTLIKTKMQTIKNWRKLLVNRRTYTSRWNTLTKYFDQKELNTKRLFFDRFTERSIYGMGMYGNARYHHAARLGTKAMNIWNYFVRSRKNEMVSIIFKVAEETHPKYEYNSYPVEFMREVTIVAISNHYRIFRFNRFMKRFKYWCSGREQVRNKIAKMTRYRGRRMLRFWMSLAWWKSKGQTGKLYKGGCAIDKYISRTNWKLAFTSKAILKSPRSLNIRTSFNGEEDDHEYEYTDGDLERSFYSPNEKMSLSAMGAGLALGMGSGMSRSKDHYLGNGNKSNSGTDIDDHWFDNDNGSRNFSPTTNSTSYHGRNRIFSPVSLLSVSPLPRMPPNRTAIMNMIKSRNQKTLSRWFTVWKVRSLVPVTVRRRRRTLQRAFRRFSRKLVSNRVNKYMNTIASNFAESRAQYRFLMILMENAVGDI